MRKRRRRKKEDFSSLLFYERKVVECSWVTSWMTYDVMLTPARSRPCLLFFCFFFSLFFLCPGRFCPHIEISDRFELTIPKNSIKIKYGLDSSILILK